MLKTGHIQNATCQNRAQTLTFPVDLHPLDRLCPLTHIHLHWDGGGEILAAEQKQFLE